VFKKGKQGIMFLLTITCEKYAAAFNLKTTTL
jgi:hypothetical protein